MDSGRGLPACIGRCRILVSLQPRDQVTVRRMSGGPMIRYLSARFRMWRLDVVSPSVSESVVVVGVESATSTATKDVAKLPMASPKVSGVRYRLKIATVVTATIAVFGSLPERIFLKCMAISSLLS